MTRKRKILYSELTSSSPSAAAPKVTPAAPPPETPAATSPPLKRAAPVELARALAAARAAEAAAEAVAAPLHPVEGRLTPVRGTVRVTPVHRMARITPIRGTPAVSGMRTLRDRVRARSGELEVLLFRVNSERFGIALGTVDEAIDLPPVHHVPEMPPAMLGVITVRDTLTPVYSPQGALGISLNDGASALIFKRGRSRLAVVIDDVEDVMTLDLALLRDAPGIEGTEGIVLGVVRQHDALLALVDTDALLAACQAVPLLETA
jgi:purine-binding chemotaxis protein CheW